MFQPKDKLAILILIILFFFIAFPRISFPDLDHGDEFADANVLSAGENYVKFGFITCRFLPMFEPYDTLRELYTHYPPLSEVINGFFQMVMPDSLVFYRGVALFFALLNLIFWYLFVKKFSGSTLIGFLAALFYFTNPFFIFGMDSLQQLSYADCLRSLVLLIFISLPKVSGRNKTNCFFILWGLLFIETLMTFEYVVYLALFFILFGIFFKEARGGVSKKNILILFSAPVCGFLLHYLQNAWYFGSFNAAFADLRTRAVVRMFSSEDNPISAFNFFTWWKYVISRNFSLVLIFNYIILGLVLFFSFFLYHNLSSLYKPQIRRLSGLCILLAICGVSWYVIFPSHSIAHTFVMFLVRHLIPLASIVFTLFCYILLCFVKENNPRNFFGKIAFSLVIIIIMLSGISKSNLPVTADRIKQAKDFLEFKRCLISLKGMSKDGDEVGVNYYRNPFMRYYTNRHFSAIFNKSQLENKLILPKYFILLPYDNPTTKELFAFIEKRYAYKFSCNSGVFPSVFFELKE
jgi:hypothetical protein